MIAGSPGAAARPKPADRAAATAGLDRSTLLDDLASGRLRAAWPDPEAAGGWRVDVAVKAAILERFTDRTMVDWSVGPFRFRDRAGLPVHDLADPSLRIVPGGTSVRAGVHLGHGVVVMPPSYLNVGAFVGAGTMVDSHVLVGSCAQVGARVHLAAGVTIGGVLEPSGARPVIVEDEVFVGGGCGLYEGVLVGRGAVLAAGVVLTGTSRLYDLVREEVRTGTPDRPLAVPPGAVVVPGTRALQGSFAGDLGLGVTTAVIIKDRDAGTDARVALEAALR